MINSRNSSAEAPFVKVEATRFTEVGYVGRDVEQIVRDLVEISIHMTREQMRKEVTAKAELHAEERVLDALVGKNASKDTRSKFRTQLRNGELSNKEIITHENNYIRPTDRRTEKGYSIQTKEKTSQNILEGQMNYGRTEQPMKPISEYHLLNRFTIDCGDVD